MKLSTFLHKRLVDLLDERRIVVWYDAGEAFGDFAVSFKAPNCVVVSAAESILRARRRVDEVYDKMNESEDSVESRANLLIYIPRARGETMEELMVNAQAHAKEHGITEVTPELMEKIKAHIEDDGKCCG